MQLQARLAKESAGDCVTGVLIRVCVQRQGLFTAHELNSSWQIPV